MRLHRFPAFVFSVCVALLLTQQGSRALPLATDALRFFNNFFITGSYATGGAGLWNTGSGAINVSAVPAGAEVLGAFLYFQVVTSSDPTVVDVNAGATFNGLPLNVPLGTQLLPTSKGVEVGTQACPLNGGSGKHVYTFRSDVLSYLDEDLTTGMRVINKPGGYPVAFPGGGGRVLGASLVVIYRDYSQPLNNITIYDGTFVKGQNVTLRQRIEGFYDPTGTGSITYIGGSGQNTLGETLTGPFATQNGLFRAALGDAWDNVTRTTNDLGGATSFDTSIAPQFGGFFSFLNDCITMGAMIYKTQVNDGDGDGLLDRWETSDVALSDPNGQPLPNFKAMGANKDVPDVFIEIAGMQAPPETTYGSDEAPMTSTVPSVTDHLGHLHIPPPAVLKTWADPFAAKNIHVHFDVGKPSTYKGLVAYPGQLGASPYNSNVADDYIIGAGGQSGSDASLASGGEIVQETACTPSPGPPAVDCQFPDYPGTVIWKSGFMLYKNLLFDKNRKDSFRFAFYAHSKAAPKSVLPCTGASGAAGLDPMTGMCAPGAEPNPLIHVPGGVSGSAELDGGDLLVSLGLWDSSNFVGPDDGIAFTSMHEFGHTLGLLHGGDTGLNCKPNYVSLMNYSFQLGGVIDNDGNAHAVFSDSALLPIEELHLDDNYEIPGSFRTSWYAPRPAGDLREPMKRFCNGLKFDPSVPADDPIRNTIRVDGTVDPSLTTKINWNINSVNEPDTTQDVNFDGEPDAVPDGPPTTLTGFSDWTHLRLNQVGSRRNFGGISIGPLEIRILSDGSGLLSNGTVLLADGTELLADGTEFLADGTRILADGAEFLADGSVLLADGTELLADGVELLSDGSRIMPDGTKILQDGSGAELLADGSRVLSNGSVLLADGSVFLADGVEFLADGSVLLADGVEFLADGSMLLADGSPLLTNGIALAWEFTEETPHAAAESGTIGGPTSLTACVIGETCGPEAPTEPLHRVWLHWNAPLGVIDHYVVYRAQGDSIGLVTDFTDVPGTDTSVVDGIELPSAITFPPGLFTYVVEAVLNDDGHTVTPRSNQRTITAFNNKPVANAQAVEVWEDYPTATNNITLTGADDDSSGTAFSIVDYPTHGLLSGTPPNVTYTPALNYNGPDAFSFKLSETTTWHGMNQDSDPAVVTITVDPVNDKPTFTKGTNQSVYQNAPTQTVTNWATNFIAGPPDEVATQAVLQYIVSNDNSVLFEAGGQPAISNTGELTYMPKSGGPTGVANVTVQVQDNGGTAEGHGAVDTSDPPQYFTITITPPPVSLKFEKTDVWMSTSSSNRTYDLKTQVFKNDVLLFEKVITNTTLGYGTTFNKAIEKVIGSFPTTLVGFVPTDKLSVNVSIKVASGSSGGPSASGAIRLWYNVPTTASMPTKDSHLHAKRNGADVRYYLISAFKLQKDGLVAGPTQSIDAVVYKTDFTVLGTWSVTGP